jgi:hypothetical protein
VSNIVADRRKGRAEIWFAIGVGLFTVLAAPTVLVVGGIVCAPALVAGGTVLWQVFTWLQTGVWTPVSTLVAWKYYFAGTGWDQWLSQPTSWFGLHSLVVRFLDLPLSVTGVVLSALLLWLALWLVIGVAHLAEQASKHWDEVRARKATARREKTFAAREKTLRGEIAAENAQIDEERRLEREQRRASRPPRGTPGETP